MNLLCFLVDGVQQPVPQVSLFENLGFHRGVMLETLLSCVPQVGQAEAFHGASALYLDTMESASLL